MAGHDVEELLQVLTNAVQDGFSLGRAKCVIDRAQLLELIEDIENRLPSEIEQARNIVATKNEILGSAKREADAIKRAAEERARQLVSQDEVVVAARQKAGEIVNAAEQKSKELRIATNRYVDDALARAQEALEEALGEVKTSRGSFKSASKN